MALLIIVFLLALGGPIAVGVASHRRSWSVRGGPTSWGELAAARFGAVPAAVLLLLVGVVVTLVIGLGLGFLAKGVADHVDHPVFNWVTPRVHLSHFTTVNEKLTLIGNNATVQPVVLIATVVLAFAFARRWWIAVIAVLGGYFFEHYAQKFLAKIVDRGHPPTTLGTYPSGGVARILGVYGIIVFLAIVLLPRLSRAWRTGLWTGLATAATVEAFTRVYLSKHWLTDALFGLPVGALMLLTAIVSLSALLASQGVTASAGARSAHAFDGRQVA